jgi:hypothetical protein
MSPRSERPLQRMATLRDRAYQSAQEEIGQTWKPHLPAERVVPAGTDSVVISNSAVGIGGRWDTFQSRLRERRKEVVAQCTTCAGESALKRGSESVDTLRKAV